jgi:hypothetical protein
VIIVTSNNNKTGKQQKPRQPQPPGFVRKDERDYSGKTFKDMNAHDFPGRYDPQEQTLLEKIAQRQKRFMKKSGEEEVRFVNRSESTYSEGVSVDHNSEVNDLSNLFRD